MLRQIFPLSDRVRLMVLAGTIVIVLAVINLEIVHKEQILKEGTTVLLRLAPRDPRSLLQGDYMALRYSLVNEIARQAGAQEKGDGIAVIELGELNVASLVALYSGQQLQHGQYLLRYRKRGESVRLASDAFFFEEGSGPDYSGARFGEVRINAEGEAVLVGLRNAEGQRIGVALHQLQ